MAVLGPVESNALLYVREGMGVRARSRSEHCYWIEGTVPTEAFDVFHTEDADFFVDVDALHRAIDRTRADRVALRGKPDGSVVLEDGYRPFPVEASDVHLEDNPSWMERRPLFEAVASLEFGDSASTLQALVGADTAHDHDGITAQKEDGSAEVFLFDADGDDRTVGLRLGPAVSPGTPGNGHRNATGRHGTALPGGYLSSALSRARDCDADCPGTLRCAADLHRVRRADGWLSVTGENLYKEDAPQTLMILEQGE